jgi:fatty acid desaturase
MENKGLNLVELKKLLADCFQPNPWIYWTDLLFTCAAAYTALYFTRSFPSFSLMQIFLFFVSVFGLYRAILFTHEVAHQERKDLPGFSIAFNLLAGVPLLLPSFMYRGVHIDHHKRNMYGTPEDGEYLPLGASPFWKTLAYIAQVFYLPFLVVIRFGLLGPLSLVSPKLRHLVMTRASSLAIHPNAARKIPTGIDLRNWHILEFLAFLNVLFLLYLAASDVYGLGTIIHLYIVFVTVGILNSVRTVVAHRYLNKDLKEMPFTDQLLDSVNLDGSPLLELMAPVGLRFHALHHLFPSIPYHNLGIAHRRLKATLPADSIYSQMNEPSLFSALKNHWKNTQGKALEPLTRN